MLDQPIAQIKGLRVEFETKDGPVVGVENVSFDVTAGETLCIVGESGSGKSVSSLSLMRLVEYGGGTIAGGELMFNPGDGEAIDLAQAETDLMKQIRGNQIGMIFQEPMTALNPVFTVGRQLTEGLRIHKGMDKKQAEARAIEILREVRIPEAERRMKQYPHELSGGMRQRVVIAMAMACEPRLLIADEPTTALDVTIQAEILALMDRLKRETGTTWLLWRRWPTGWLSCSAATRSKRAPSTRFSRTRSMTIPRHCWRRFPSLARCAARITPNP
jgi:peptide/nickel transport system ATP-binding protein/glutathione transport system ATP-binding protein